MQVQDKVAFITGAGSGIGRAAAVLLAKEGAHIAALSHTADELESLVEGIESGGGRAIPVVADVSKPDEMQRAVQETVERLGSIDIVFANAGINGVWAPLEELE